VDQRDAHDRDRVPQRRAHRDARPQPFRARGQFRRGTSNSDVNGAG
jgi:hypothetical protein